MKATEASTGFELTGGALCLDFANTLGDRPRATEESLHGYEDLLRFSREAKALPAGDLRELKRLIREHPRCGRATFARAIELRETLYRIFSRLARSLASEAEDIQLLNAALHKALRQLEVRGRKQSFEWAWGGPANALDRPLWPVVRSAAELLTSDEAGYVRECDSKNCSWLFVDRSRTRRRRWCDMATCGNRAKARRHYQRRKQGDRIQNSRK